MTEGVRVDETSATEADLARREATGAPAHRTPLSSRYRFLVELCSEFDGPVTIDRLVDPMCHWERGLTGSSREKSWGDVHEELFRVDLPVLDRAGLLEFDASTGLVDSVEEE